MLDDQQLNNKLSIEIWKSNLFVVVKYFILYLKDTLDFVQIVNFIELTLVIC